MEVETLTLFVDVARAGSFAAAARQSNIDPSLVSRRISGLERELGFRLFQRTTRTIALTEAGTDFLNRIETHLTAIEEAKVFGRDLVEQPTGLLRITASTSFGHEVLTPLLPGFRALYPHLHLELLLSDRRVHLIEEGIDLAIRLGQLSDSDLIAKKIMPIEFRVYASPDYLKANDKISKPKDLEQHDCLLYPSGGYTGTLTVSAPRSRPSTIDLQGTVTISNAMSLRQCAIYGMGPALLPNWLVKNDVKQGRLVDVLPRHTYRSDDPDPAAWFVYPSRLYVPTKVRRFMEYAGRALSG